MSASNHQPISADFPFESHYAEVNGSKIHYIDEGEGDPVLFLHGNPTSSYLWRNIIPHISPHARCIAPDLIGMGKSDKPNIPYRFFDHVTYIEGLIEQLGLRNITLVIHDWGSAIGFHYAMRHEDNIKGIAFMEAIIRPMEWSQMPTVLGFFFRMMRTPVFNGLLLQNLNLFVNQVLPASVIRGLSEAEMKHYRAPYPTAKSRFPIAQWPREVPISGHPADVVEAVGAYNRRLQESVIPKLLLYATPGAIVPPELVEWCRKNLPNLKLVDLGKGNHYLQEDHPHKIGAEIAEWYQLLSPTA